MQDHSVIGLTLEEAEESLPLRCRSVEGLTAREAATATALDDYHGQLREALSAG